MSVKQMGEVWDLELPPTRKLILLALADHADHNGERVYPSVGRIAYKTGFSRRQVQYELKALRDEVKAIELVREGGGRGNPSEYKLTLENCAKSAPFEARGKGAQRAPKKTERVQTTTQKGARVAPEPSIEPSVNRTTSSGAVAPEEVGQDKKTPQQKLTIRLDDRLRQSHNTRLTPQQFGFHIDKFRDILQKDNPTPDELDRVVEHIVSSLAKRPKIDARTALQDVRLGRDTGEAWQGEAPWEKAKRESEPDPYKHFRDFTGVAARNPVRKQSPEEIEEVIKRIERERKEATQRLKREHENAQ